MNITDYEILSLYVTLTILDTCFIIAGIWALIEMLIKDRKEK